jgi:hypothetical protein
MTRHLSSDAEGVLVGTVGACSGNSVFNPLSKDYVPLEVADEEAFAEFKAWVAEVNAEAEAEFKASKVGAKVASAPASPIASVPTSRAASRLARLTGEAGEMALEVMQLFALAGALLLLAVTVNPTYFRGLEDHYKAEVSAYFAAHSSERTGNSPFEALDQQLAQMKAQDQLDAETRGRGK